MTSRVVAQRFWAEAPSASGGMGTVCRAHDEHTGAHVALKTMRPSSRQSVDRFLREARVLAELHHPGIVQYVAHGLTAEGELFLAMEWLEGEDLKDRLARAAVTPREALQLVTGAAAALAAAHARHIVHRDIKPANMFLCQGQPDRLKLLDFGVARLELEVDDLTGTGDIIGTPLYMAPEQALANPVVTARADVYALGAVLYRCLTGKPPFSGPSIGEVLAAKTSSEPLPLRASCPDLAPEIEALVAQMLARDPARRPPDGAAVLSALLSLGDTTGTRPSARSASYELTEAEEQIVCVLVADLPERASSEPGERTEPLLSPGQSLMAVAKVHGGELVWLADGAPALTFSRQGVARDLVTRAARCALALRELDATVPVGIATGRGSVTRALAERLRQGAGTGEIRIDTVTAGLLDARFDVRGDDQGLSLRGEQVGEEPTRMVLGQATSFVGRDRELARLTATFDECAAESEPRVLLVTAPPGMGKSRLASELVRHVRTRGRPVQVWIARGDPMRSGVPLGILGEAVRSAMGLEPGLRHEARRELVRARVARRVPAADVARVSEFLGELAGVPFPSEQSPQLQAARRDPQVMSHQVRRAWIDWVGAEAGAGPLLIFLDDMQWGDAATIKLIDAALQAAADRPLMVLGVARPEVHELFPRLWADRGVEEIHLGELSRKASERLVTQVLAGATAQSVARIIERAVGNPFYLEELIRHAAGGKDEQPPETILAMVTSRIAGLPPETRRVLRAASVFGEVFWVGGVKALLGASTLPGVQVEARIAELEERELVVWRGGTRFAAERELAFRHSMVRDAAYAMLVDDDRVLGHKLAGAWLEEVGEDEASVLADHAERADDPARAVAWLKRAAEQALQRGDVPACLAHCARGAAAGASGEDLGALTAFESEATFWTGDLRTAESRAVRAMELLPAGSELWYGSAMVIFHQPSTEEQLRRVVGLIAQQQPGDSVGYRHTRAWMMAGRTAALVGQLPLAGMFRARIAQVAERLGDDPRALGFRSIHEMFWCSYAEWHPWRRLREGRLALDLFQRAGSHLDATMSSVFMGWLHLAVGGYAAAERILVETMAVGQKGFTTPLAQHYLGRALLGLGRTEEARAVQREARAGLQAGDNWFFVAMAQQAEAELELAAGDADAAEREARRASELVTVLPSARIGVLATLARALLAQGRAGDALAAAREGFELMRALGCSADGDGALRLVHAEALAATGDHEGARRAIAEARDRLRAFIDDPEAEPALRQEFLAVPENARTLALAEAWTGA